MHERLGGVVTACPAAGPAFGAAASGVTIVAAAHRRMRTYEVDFRNFSMPLRANPIDLWCAKVTAAVALRAPKILLRHSDLFSAAGLSALQPIASGALGGRSFPLVHGGATVRLPPFNESRAHGVLAKYNHVFSRRAFLRARGDARERRWLAHYSQADLAWVNAEVEWRCGARARGGGDIDPNSMQREAN